MNTTGEMTRKAAGGAPSWPVEPGSDLAGHDVWHLVTETVMENDWVSGSLPSSPVKNGLHPLMMLQLVTYFYATGTLGSQAIEEEATRDPLALAVCAGFCVDAWQVHCFRRDNAELLRQTLARVFRRMWQHPSCFGNDARLNARQITWQSEQAATDCLTQAIFLDSMALDE